jgi:hypothetical protein
MTKDFDLAVDLSTLSEAEIAIARDAVAAVRAKQYLKAKSVAAWKPVLEELTAIYDATTETEENSGDAMARTFIERATDNEWDRDDERFLALVTGLISELPLSVINHRGRTRITWS